MIGLVSGLVGSMAGIGGGALIVPFLSLGLGIPLHTAIGTSVVSVIANSSTATSAYMMQKLVNIRLGVVLVFFTILGAIAGGITAAYMSQKWLSLLFAIILIINSLSMVRYNFSRECEEDVSDTVIGFSDENYFDPYHGKEVKYRVRRLPLGLGSSFIAGNVSGLLGIGGGVIMVPVMVLLMRVPMRVATATSIFMIGTTAAASAFVYYRNGFINPSLIAPVLIGVFIGALLGSRLSNRVNSRVLVYILVTIMLFLAIGMLAKAF